MKSQCQKCGTYQDDRNLTNDRLCHDCDRKRRYEEDDDQFRKSINAATGDSFNTGMPGGFDGDMTTPI